jgi:hypothetical protein
VSEEWFSWSYIMYLFYWYHISDDIPFSLSRVATKPTKCVCDQHGSRPACASAKSDQNPCCSLTNPLTRTETDSEQHGTWSDCADAQLVWIHAGRKRTMLVLSWPGLFLDSFYGWFMMTIWFCCCRSEEESCQVFVPFLCVSAFNIT